MERIDRKRRKPPDPTAAMTPDEKKAHEAKVRGDTAIAEMGLPVRIVNALEGEGMILARDLLTRKRDDVTNIKNFGEKTLREIVEAIRRLGMTPPGEWTAVRRKEKKSRGREEDPFKAR